MSLVPRLSSEQRERRLAVASALLTALSIVLCHLWWWSDPQATAGELLGDALLFAGSLMTFLAAHELGHWWAACRRGFHLSLPIFLPLPIFIGTLGAVIGIHDRPPDRRAVLEMAVAGPLCGVLAIGALLLLRMLLGEAVLPGDAAVRLSTPLLLRLFGVAAHSSLAVPADPVVFAAWTGCLVTALNLLPVGQLDGGHIAAAAWPKAAPWIGRISTGLALGAGLAWPGWALWIAAAWLLAERRPVRVRRPSRSPGRHAVAVPLLAALLWLLTTSWVPLSLTGSPPRSMGEHSLVWLAEHLGIVSPAPAGLGPALRG